MGLGLNSLQLRYVPCPGQWYSWKAGHTWLGLTAATAHQGKLDRTSRSSRVHARQKGPHIRLGVVRIQARFQGHGPSATPHLLGLTCPHGFGWPPAWHSGLALTRQL